MRESSPQKSLFLGPKISGAMLPCFPISAIGTKHAIVFLIEGPYIPQALFLMYRCCCCCCLIIQPITCNIHHDVTNC